MNKPPIKDKTSPNMAEKACQEPEDEDPLSGLSPRQDRALQALLQEPTIGRAAMAAGVGELTLYRWMQDPTFRTALLAARREAFGQGIEDLAVEGFERRSHGVGIETGADGAGQEIAGQSHRTHRLALILLSPRGRGLRRLSERE